MRWLSDFRLVGGTALSLHLGHRMSDDIDMFTHQPDGTVPFAEIEKEISAAFPITVNTDKDFPELQVPEKGAGLHLFVGNNETRLVKLDILNWDEGFLFPVAEIDGIRLASIEEIAIMKLDAIARGGRKKDFWDLSEILGIYNLSALLQLYRQKHPHNDIEAVITGLSNFSTANNMPDPICYKGKNWETIMEEIKYEIKML